jgi:hypothetical protein
MKKFIVIMLTGLALGQSKPVKKIAAPTVCQQLQTISTRWQLESKEAAGAAHTLGRIDEFERFNLTQVTPPPAHLADCLKRRVCREWDVTKIVKQVCGPRGAKK